MRNFWFPAESSPLYWKAPTCGFISLLPFNSTFCLAGNSVFLQLTICWPFFCAVKESCYASGFIASNWDWFLYWKISTHAYQLTSAISMTRTSLHSNKKNSASIRLLTATDWRRCFVVLRIKGNNVPETAHNTFGSKIEALYRVEFPVFYPRIYPHLGVKYMDLCGFTWNGEWLKTTYLWKYIGDYRELEIYKKYRWSYNA